MQLTVDETRRTPHDASRLVQAMSAWSVKTRRAPSRHCRDARVYGHPTTAMRDIEYPPLPCMALRLRPMHIMMSTPRPPSSLPVHSSDTSGLASPENYEQFPQPFSGFDVPVLPYAMDDGNASRGGHGNNGRDGSSTNHVGGDGDGGNGGVGHMWARRAEPEIDVTDLVMDNNDYDTPDVATKCKSLEEAALVVAVAAASTKAGAGAEAGAGAGAVAGPGTGTGGGGVVGRRRCFAAAAIGGGVVIFPPRKAS